MRVLLLGRSVISVSGQNLHPAKRDRGHDHVGAERMPQAVKTPANTRCSRIILEPVAHRVFVGAHQRIGQFGQSCCGVGEDDLQ